MIYTIKVLFGQDSCLSALHAVAHMFQNFIKPKVTWSIYLLLKSPKLLSFKLHFRKIRFLKIFGVYK